MGIAAAAAADPDASAGAGAPVPDVSLDQLLKLPDAYNARAPTTGGASREEWENRFREVDQDLDRATSALRKAQDELDQLAVESSSWQVAAPGSDDPQNSPLSFKLRQEIRRQRDAIEQAKRRQRELMVEANLAGVPPTWRAEAGDPPSSRDRQ